MGTLLEGGRVGENTNSAQGMWELEAASFISKVILIIMFYSVME